MNYQLCALALAGVLLAGCAVHEAAEKKDPSYQEAVQSAPAPQADREARRELEGVGTAALYSAQGYSLYIPTEGWTLELDSTGDIPHTTWTVDATEGASLTVYDYEDVSFMVALDRFTRSSRYLFDEGPTARLDDPLTGRDGYGGEAGVMVAEGLEGITYVILWEYPEGADCAAALAAAAETFALTE